VPLLRRALELQPRLTEARVKLADALQALGQTDEDMAELERVVAAEPLQRPRSWFNLGVLRAEAGDHAGAEQAFAEAARTDPVGGAGARIQLGSVRMARGDLAGAEAAFEQALAVQPDDPAAHGSLALVHLERGELGEARTRLLRVLELDPANQPAQALLEQIGADR
jgi:tetratricopeptide (TPR) repeat protein